jgi:hypothetical protein
MSGAYRFQEYDVWNDEIFSNILAHIAVIFRADDLGGGLAALIDFAVSDTWDIKPLEDKTGARSCPGCNHMVKERGDEKCFSDDVLNEKKL